MFLIRILVALTLLSAPARGEVPKVVADIAPVHSLVAMVMQGVGVPDLIVGASDAAHGGALRPSQARAVQGADLVIWVGPELTPWLEKPLKALASGADQLVLLKAPQTRRLTNRGGKGVDPHVWLDPENGRIWLGLIADRLVQMNPENARVYRANAAAGQAILAQVQDEITAMLGPVRGQPYVTYHDAYQYFETRFGLVPVGSVTSGDATPPGPLSLAQLRAKAQEAGVTCVLSEAQIDPGLLYAVAGQDGVTLRVLDPLGRGQTVGPGLYPGVLREMGGPLPGVSRGDNTLFGS